ncbi:DUF4349 domain-containing protein [Streptomyces sp. NPDC000983]|uniref:DUF4349 domain-containing protein n=1 Tax=Streptomyces sp. NPDC000983 TaxID=3154373 RepID=UPI00332726C5
MRAPRSVRPVPALAGLLLAAALALTGCTGAAGGADSADSAGLNEAAKSQADGAPGTEEGYAAGDPGAGRAEAPPRATASHIIRTASLTVQVKDVPKALDEARTVTENAGGYIGNETTTRDGRGRERTRVVLRVPVASYADVLSDLEGTGKLIDRSAKAQDVTEQVVDVESRVKTQRASVARIRELMDQATKLSDVVTLEGELSTRQADLESLLAQQASLKDRTSMATVTLSLTETPVKRAAADDDPGVADALTGGWDAFVTTLRWIVMALAAVLPFAAVAALVVVVWVRLARRGAGRRAEAEPVQTAVGPLPAARPARDPDGAES